MKKLRFSKSLLVVCAVMMVGLGRDPASLQDAPSGMTGPDRTELAAAADSSGSVPARSDDMAGAADEAPRAPESSAEGEQSEEIIASETNTDEYSEASVATKESEEIDASKPTLEEWTEYLESVGYFDDPESGARGDCLLCSNGCCGAPCVCESHCPATFCSPICNPGNVLCLTQCGGNPCNVLCNPGPCGTGCPDECNSFLCHDNFCNQATCGGQPQCDITCPGGNICGSGCPDECSSILCHDNFCNQGTCGGQPQCDVSCPGGNICGSGCPDECSSILCHDNFCNQATCGGQPQCDVTCPGGNICASGCPDECSLALCPGNHFCEAQCGGSPCDVGCVCDPRCPNTACDIVCGGDACSSGCPDECSPILCSQNPCSKQTACGGVGERACCVFEDTSSCNPGLVEDAPCTNADCGFLGCSLGTCVDPQCGDDGERACCFGEEAIVVGHTCAPGLIEVTGCSGDCACRGLAAIGNSSGTCVDSPCGGNGQRACCVNDPGGSGTGLLGSGCIADLVEKGDCLSILGSGNCGTGVVPCSIGVCLEITECGGEGQRACCFLEDISIGACETGLVENGSCASELGITNCFCPGVGSSGGVCKQPDCGGDGERGCCLLERIPSCDPGLIEDLTPSCVSDPPPGGCDCGFGPGESLGVCRNLKGIGETGCDAVFDPCVSSGRCLATSTGTICVPKDTDGLFGDEVCAAFYNPALGLAANNANVTLTFSTAVSASAIVTGTVEVGVAYSGVDQCYGCFFTKCVGVDFDLAVGIAACIGETHDGLFGSVAGDSCSITIGADFPLIEIGGSVSSIWTGSGIEDCLDDGAPDATAACFSVGLGVNPITLEIALCNTVTNLVGCVDDTVSGDGDIILAPDEAPVCFEGITFRTCPGSSIALTPMALDPDGDPLTYSWSTDCPGGSFDNNTLAAPTLSFNPAPSCAALNCTVTLTADGSVTADGNTTPVQVVCVASVVNDTVAPEFTGFPADQTLECPGDTSVAANGAATAVDACGKVLMASSDSSEAGCGNSEIITRTWTASDSCGNSKSRDQIITVVDTTDPVLKLPPNVTVACDADSSPKGTGSATATDNCDGAPTVTSSDGVAAGTCGNESVITRTWTATDACGHSVSAAQTITVEYPTVDLGGYGDFEACVSGPDGGLGIGCECFDVDLDNDVDLKNYACFQNTFAGP